MVSAIIGLVGVGTALVAWWSGYHAGRADGQLGVSQVWPWSEVARDREEG